MLRHLSILDGGTEPGPPIDLVADLADPLAPARLRADTPFLVSSREPEPSEGLLNRDHSDYVRREDGRDVMLDRECPGAITRWRMTVGDPIRDAVRSPSAVRRVLASAWVALVLTACTEVPGAHDVGDASTVDSAPATLDAWRSIRDGGPDADLFDASITPELSLVEYDLSPCPVVARVPGRARGLPTDRTPRILWARTLRELGIGGSFTGAALGRGERIHLSTVQIVHQHFELDFDGVVIGAGRAFERTKGPQGPMAALFDDRVAEWSSDAIRLDQSPPASDSGAYASFEYGEDSAYDRVDLATTTDGFYAYRGSRAALRSYCADGRLRWELRGISGSFHLQVESDDSVWINGGVATGNQAVRVSSTGEVVERVDWPEGAARVDMTVWFAGDTRFVNVLSADLRSSVFVAIDETSGAEIYRIAEPFDDLISARADPTNGVWTQQRGDLRLTHYVDGVAVGRTPMGLSIGLSSSIVADDGSLIVQGGTSDSRTVMRILPDGSVAWTLSIPGTADQMLLDVDGRLYVFGSGIVVVQTDALPPASRGCWQYRCSPQGDHRLWPDGR